jgi:hypothetical protein
MTIANLTEKSIELFRFYADDAANWSGNPWLNGNRTFTKEDRGNLTQLKKAGLLRTARDSEFGEYIVFTKEGIEYAATLGIEMEISWAQ